MRYQPLSTHDSRPPDRTGQDRTGQDRTGTGQDRTGQNIIGQYRTISYKTDYDQTGHHYTGQDRIGQDRDRDRTGQDRAAVSGRSVGTGDGPHDTWADPPATPPCRRLPINYSGEGTEPSWHGEGAVRGKELDEELVILADRRRGMTIDIIVFNY